MNGCVNSRPAATRSSRFGHPDRPEGGLSQEHHPELQVLSRRCLQGLSAFLLLSTGFFAIRSADLLAPLPENLRELLGCPPPPALTTLLLGVYLFAAAVPVLDRAARGARPRLKWRHLFYRTVFYPFYAVAGALGEHFIVAFVAGLVLFGLELLSVWSYAVKRWPEGGEMAGRP